ncbi:ChaN family lipoprotein [Proteus alimentorum]|uniref:ChaN family lipoprotein n=1 Tax=Proteus alimentorum TaxID=1973495 RepID=A0ABS0IQ47_9GAMM|nr:ChaN family lipoprotein [Proteus alimentorum]MBG2874738.1 ChaN family lipoprotein [Proteus alimentorum]MBG2878126.1 ChaN family lipoprotein [Proteus alimentorum]
MFFSISKRILLLTSLITVSACSSIEQKTAPITPSLMITSANIIDTQTGQSITAETLLTQLASQSRVIIGEKHDNQYHHDIEYWLITELPKKRPQGAVLLEMLTPNQQSLVDNTKKRYSGSEYLRDERLMAALKWNSGWPWKWYGNIVKAGLRADYPLLAANIDRSEISSAYKNPPIIDGVHSTDPSVRQLIQKTIELSHGGELDKTQAEKMTVIQQLRDRAMAKSLLDAPAPALLIAGSFHATKVMGVPLHVADLAPNENVTVVIMTEEGSDITSVHADYLWITPVALP